MPASDVGQPEGMETMAPSTGYLAPSFAHATVGDAMRPWVLTADPATPLVTVAQRMAGEQIHAIVVVGGETPCASRSRGPR